MFGSGLKTMKKYKQSFLKEPRLENFTISRELRRKIIAFQYLTPKLKLIPISCCVCGYKGKGKNANRSTVCWRCRIKWV
jgi:predicted Zn-ribbon and HTH transcriptional regulator